MSTPLLTLILAVFIVVLAVALLGIGWLLTGKSKISPGACGRAPQAKKDDSCSSGVSCSLCDKDKK